MTAFVLLFSSPVSAEANSEITQFCKENQTAECERVIRSPPSLPSLPSLPLPSLPSSTALPSLPSTGPISIRVIPFRIDSKKSTQRQQRRKKY